MGQLTQSYENYERPGLVIAYKMAVAKAWKGGLVGIDGTGYLRPMDPGVAGMRFMGVANETVDNAAGAPGDRTLNVTKTGSFVMKAAAGYAPAIADLGREVYATSDWEASPSSAGLANATKVGTIVAIEPTGTGANGVRVRIDNHSV